MRRACAWAVWLAAGVAGLGGCGGGGTELVSARMSLQASGGLTTVGAIEILVLGGDGATCARALAPLSPLDDARLVVVAHALFANDGSVQHLSIPANQRLAFYAEAYASAASRTPRIGRGCAEQTLSPGSTAAVTILISGEQTP